jgi:hypothetical protein
MRIRLKRCVFLAATCGTLALATNAFGGVADLPTPGVFVQCTFATGSGGATTTCVTTTVTVDGPACFDDDATIAAYGSPIVRYDVTQVAFVTRYAGNATAGSQVTDETGQTYYTAMKPHAKIVSQSGPFASGVRFTFLVDSCTSI